MKALILGGSGTLGKALTAELAEDVVIFSRGELAQKQMAEKFPLATYVIGDIRDRYAVRQAMRGVDVVFILAAIKHIDVAEKNPLEALKTNVLGVVNAAEEAIAQRVPHVVFSNTDKAVLPVTTYGYTKALAQNYLLSLNGRSPTRFSAYSWGNIAASRGSVIPIFVEALLRGKKVPVTDLRMSRFWLKIETAARFMMETYLTAHADRCMIPPVKGASVVRVIETIAKILSIPSYEFDVIGLRCTEKIYEVLETSHAGCLRSDTCEQFSDLELYNFLQDIVLEIAYPMAQKETA